jgi:PST family polysaccharide transporter
MRAAQRQDEPVLSAAAPPATMSVGANARWIGAAQVVRVSLQLATLTVLARLLSPSDYGLMSMATVVTTFATLFRDLGTAAAVVQRRELSHDLVSTMFWLNAALGVALGASIVTSAPWLEAWLKLPGLSPVLMAVAPSFVLVGASSTQQALLERRQDFRTLTYIDVSAALFAAALCIVAAFLHFGVYSLVVQLIAHSALSSVWLWLAARWRPRAVFARRQIRALLGFSGNLAAFNFINYFARNADNVIIGRVLGSQALGSYSLAYRLMMFPVQNLTLVAGRALLPVLSRRQAHDSASTELHLRTVRAVGFMTAPLMATMLVLRRPLVRAAFGPQWDDAAELLTWLAPTGYIQSIVSTTGAVLTAAGRTRVLFALGTMNALLAVSAFMIGVFSGTLALVRWYFVANLIGAPITLLCVMRVQGGSFRPLARALVAPTCAGLVTGLAALSAERWIELPSAYWRFELAAALAFGALAYLSLLLSVFRGDGAVIATFLRLRR